MIKNYKNLEPAQQKLIDQVRRDLGAAGANFSDEEILEHCQNSYEMESIKLAFMWVDFKKALIELVPQKIRYLLGWL